MSQERGRKVKDIVLRIGDKHQTVKGVTEKATCGDVIKMVLRELNDAKNKNHSYVMFECGNSSKRILSDKTRVLKTMRSWGTDNFRWFCMKSAPQSGKAFKTWHHENSNLETEQKGYDLNAKIESASKLALFVQSQKMRLHSHQSRSHVTETSHVDESSVQEFLANVDQTKMANFLNFSGSVTSKEIVRLSGLSDSSKAKERVPSNEFVCAKEIKSVDNISHVKYATKKTLKPKSVTVRYGLPNVGMVKKHTFVDSEIRNAPRHSTPNHRDTKRRQKHHHDDLAEDITTKIAKLDQREHKDVILQKYFADYLSYNSLHRNTFPTSKRERGDGSEDVSSKGNPDKGDGAFSTGSPGCSYTAYARHHIDSDSGHEDNDHEDSLDNAFVCNTSRGQFANRCNYKYVHVKPLSRKPVNNDVVMATKVDKLVDYSLSDSSILESFENSVDILERNILDEDDEMASFMDSKLHDDFSDEGLSSLGSDDDREVLV